MQTQPLKATCPDCGAELGLPRYTAATVVVQRTCRKCRARWRLVVKPVVANERLQVHEVTLSKIPT